MRQLTITQSITSRGSLSLERYLQEISKLPMLTIEQEVRIAAAIRQGDTDALDSLTKANLRFVVSVAKQYQHRGLSLSDLINEGNLGLIKAAMRFDETKGFKFISYAVWWIRQGIIQALSEQARLVRLPSNRVNLGNKVQKALVQLEQLNERTPSVDELMEELNITEEEIMSVADYNSPYVSLDTPSLLTGEENMIDLIIDESSASTDGDVSHHQSLKIEVMRCLQSLCERERNIVCSFFGIGVPEPLSLNEIALTYNMTGERVRQIKDKAIKHLRHPKKSNLLKKYLGGY
jgi:RNA polymerase primary sigma factor